MTWSCFNEAFHEVTARVHVEAPRTEDESSFTSRQHLSISLTLILDAGQILFNTEHMTLDSLLNVPLVFTFTSVKINTLSKCNAERFDWQTPWWRFQPCCDVSETAVKSETWPQNYSVRIICSILRSVYSNNESCIDQYFTHSDRYINALECVCVVMIAKNMKNLINSEICRQFRHRD